VSNNNKLPSVTSDIPRDLRTFIDRLREVLTGSGSGKIVTVGDLVSAGVASTTGAGALAPAVNNAVVAPNTPTGLQADGAIQTILVTWNAPLYKGHAYAEIWGSSTDNVGEAVLLGMSPGTSFADTTGPGVVRYYWVRFVNQKNEIGAFNAVAGTRGETGPEVQHMLDLLTGQITSSQLYTDLGARINLIDASASTTNSVAWRVDQEATARTAAIIAEATARTNAISSEASTRAQAILNEAASRTSGDSSLQTQINLLSAASSGDLGELLAAVQEEQTARIAGDTAEATARTTLATQLRGDYTGTDPTVLATGIVYNERQSRITAEGVISSSISALSSTVTNNYTTLNSAITSEATTRASADSTLSSQLTTLTSTVGTNTAAITSEATTRANADSSLSTQISSLTSTVNTNTAAISTEISTRANADAALTSSITTLQSTSGANTAAIQTEATTRASETGNLFAKYTVKVDTNGYVSGFGLASTANNGTTVSDFAVRADKFYIASPSGPGVTPSMPFIVQTTQQTINGEVVPVGVYMTDAFIRNGSITNAKIANASIDSAKISTLEAGKITAGSISTGEYIQSTNFITGSQGWKIYGNGTAEFGAAAIRGQLTASQIDARGLSIKDASGNVVLNAGTGNFTGSLNGTDVSTVVSNASTALSTANSAASAASTAQSTANSASSAASTAQSTANSASSAASTAQSTANSAASAASTAQGTANAAYNGLSTKLNSDSRNVLSGSGGLATGSLNWDSSGNYLTGYGIGITQKGIVAYNSSGAATFVLNGSTGAASFAGSLSAATGTFAGSLSAASGTFTGTLSGASGTFTGTLAAATVTTDNIVSNALTSTYNSSATSSTITLSISIPANTVSAIVLASLGNGTYSAGGEGGGYYTPAFGDLLIDGATILNNVASSIVYVVPNPSSGTHTVTVVRGNYTGTMTLSVLVNKR
jgi:hypothetical protein